MFLGVWALHPAHRAEARAALPDFLRGLGGRPRWSAAVLLAYPLWLHFSGPQRYHGTGFDPRVHNEDLAAYAAFPAPLAGRRGGLDTSLAPNPTEENSFFGIPLLLLAVVCFVHAVAAAPTRPAGPPCGRWRVTGAVFAVLSLGPAVKWFGRAHRASRCRTRCSARCRCSTPRCRPGWRWCRAGRRAAAGVRVDCVRAGSPAPTHLRWSLAVRGRRCCRCCRCRC